MCITSGLLGGSYIQESLAMVRTGVSFFAAAPIGARPAGGSSVSVSGFRRLPPPPLPSSLHSQCLTSPSCSGHTRERLLDGLVKARIHYTVGSAATIQSPKVGDDKSVATIMGSAARNSMNGSISPGRSFTVDGPASRSAPTSREGMEEAVIPIAAHGDIVLRIEHEAATLKHIAQFRVSIPALRQHSKYFERLLQAGRFGEGSHVDEQHKRLRERYQSITEAPSSELPVVCVQDVGRISTVKSIAALCTDFLYVLHGKDTVTFPPVGNIANLAIVADRFDCLEVMKSYMKKKKMIRVIDGKTTSKAENALSEEKVRQRLLVAIMLDYPSWIEKYTTRMIVKGWVGKEPDLSAALWWDLPHRVEEELAYRRECALETVQSLQSFFLGLYTSRERQCKLGYDSSPQCDSFQLGEMVRFFTKVGMLQLQGAVFDTSEPPAPYEGDLHVLLDTLRQVPEYQIDRNHAHCGIRTRLIPLLDLLQESLYYTGICQDCWQEDRSHYAWTEAKRPLLWKKLDSRVRTPGHGNRHSDLRAMFTATEKDWS